MEELFKAEEHFKNFTDQERTILASYCTVKKIHKDQMLFKDGDEGDEAYIVKNGMIRLSKKMPDNEDVTLAIAKRGMVFGEVAIFGIIPRYADARALAETEVVVLSKQKYQKICAENPVIALKIVDIFISFLAMYLRKTTNRVYGIFGEKQP